MKRYREKLTDTERVKRVFSRSTLNFNFLRSSNTDIIHSFFKDLQTQFHALFYADLITEYTLYRYTNFFQKIIDNQISIQDLIK